MKCNQFGDDLNCILIKQKWRAFWGRSEEPLGVMYS